ncbi:MULTISPECIES: M20 family metallopeptidase [unclassified Sporolactobacillus]|uniref:M20 family metallopeptidase n=1 Tax=unclassified Sporolactobacillus TaxID=2628533 RepID=UPI00236892F7|nr:M20 family metallopeptidase [Sporolactobacillus sp. CQH2019]MDD9148939.1 M20 family metallopeptidase [Sporolactobacillus sp. CQH2019]
MNKVWEENLKNSYDSMVKWRRYLHQHPELSFHEKETSAFIYEKLNSFGIDDIKTNVGGYGIVARIHGSKPGITVALRADFDALPIQEETDVPYKSKVDGVMHACGHDGHTATLLGVAKVLQAHRSELSGDIVLIHQPAEEFPPGGARAMIRDGCLDGVDVIFGTHLWSTVPFGTIGYRKGYFMASADYFKIKIQGRGGHGSAPQLCVDSVAVASQIVNQLQMVVSREVDPVKSAVLTIGKFNSGVAANVIADTAFLEGTVRTFDEDIRSKIKSEMAGIIENVCGAFHAEGTLDYLDGYSAVYNHGKESDVFQKVMDKTFGKDTAVEIAPQMGGEDFSGFLLERPGIFWFTGAGNPEIGASYPHHHPKFNFDERVMIVAGKAFLAMVDKYLCTSETPVLSELVKS